MNDLKQDIKLDGGNVELGWTETRNVVHNGVKCMMKIGWQFRQANTKKQVAAFTFTFMHLANAFIQSNLQCIQAIHFCQYVCSLGIEPTTFALLTQCSSHWATGTLQQFVFRLHLQIPRWDWAQIASATF